MPLPQLKIIVDQKVDALHTSLFLVPKFHDSCNNTNQRGHTVFDALHQTSTKDTGKIVNTGRDGHHHHRSCSVIVYEGGREGGREGGMEGGKEGGREEGVMQEGGTLLHNPQCTCYLQMWLMSVTAATAF